MQNRDVNKDNLGNRDEIGRKGGAGMSGSTVHRQDSTKENIKEGWHDFKAKVRQKWNQLTDDDIDNYRSRGRSDFVNNVHTKVGGDRTAIERDIDSISRDTNYRW